MTAHDDNLDALTQLLGGMAKSVRPRHECYRCGYGKSDDGFGRNEIRVLWCRDQGELLFVEACHEHANELLREGWFHE